jgi:hypothetical protein
MLNRTVLTRVTGLVSRAAPRTAHGFQGPSQVLSRRAFPCGTRLVSSSSPSSAQVSSYEKDVTPMGGEKPKVNLYDGHYSDHTKAAQTKVRIDTYGKNGSCPVFSS